MSDDDPSARGGAKRDPEVSAPRPGGPVDAAKIRDYLLSDSHPVGRFKAAFFVALGYTMTGWERLASDLRRRALENEVDAIQANEYGQKYEVRGRIEGPSGRAADLVAVWIVLRGEDFPRLVTAFPGAKE